MKIGWWFLHDKCKLTYLDGLLYVPLFHLGLNPARSVYVVRTFMQHVTDCYINRLIDLPVIDPSAW